jgi:hypothetical protein
MKQIIFCFLTAITTILFFNSCTKINDGKVGFFSDQIRYLEDTLQIERGTARFSTKPIDLDGSTAPLKFELLDIRDSKGKSVKADFLEKKYPIATFKEGAVFNVDEDTTLALLNAKRTVTEVPGMYFLENSGILLTNQASENFPLGQYVIDVKASGPRGEKIFKNFQYFNIVDPDVSRLIVFTDRVSNSQSPPNGSDFLVQAAPIFTFQQISPAGTTLIVKFLDKNGVPFNPKNGEIERRGDRPEFTNYARFNPVIFTDTALVLKYEIAPFPITQYINKATGQNWGFLIYYRINNNFCQVDGFAPKARHVLPRFSMRVNGRGTYMLTFKFPDVTRL